MVKALDQKEVYGQTFTRAVHREVGVVKLFSDELRSKVAEEGGYGGGGGQKWPCMWRLPLDLAFFELVEGRETIVGCCFQ